MSRRPTRSTRTRKPFPYTTLCRSQRSVTADTVHFDLDQYDIDPQARAILDSQAAWLAKYPNVRVTVEGHCDERGTREYNLALGDRRANATKNYLASRGVAASRMTTISYGKERPVTMKSEERRVRNECVRTGRSGGGA